MANPAAAKSNRSVAQLIKSVSITNTDQYIHNRQLELEQWKNYWKKKQEEYFDETFDTEADKVAEAAAVRRFLNQFLEPRLHQIKKMNEQERLDSLQYLMPFSSDGGITDFMLHFFQLEQTNGKLDYVARDPFEKEVHILYDVFKIKKTMECIDTMRRTLGNPQKTFTSRFSETDKKQVLENLRDVLKVLFKYTIQPKFQKEIYQHLSMEYLSGEAILERKQKNLFYCYPHVIKKYDYRNLFFLIYFRENLVTKVSDQRKTFHYNYLKFEILKQEFLSHWLTSRLKDNPQKKEIYKKYQVDGKSIQQWVDEDPANEMPMIKKIPANQFNALVAQVDDKVDDNLKAGMPSLSEKEGELGAVKKETKKAATIAKKPLDALKSLFGMKKQKVEVKQFEEPKDTPVATEEEEVEGPPEIKIVGIKEKQCPYFYLTSSASKYAGKLGQIRLRMGDDYKVLTSLVSRVMNAFGEGGVVRRRTPKHDWVVPYHIKYDYKKRSEDYLFILGGEAKMKPKGMQYSSGDEYVYTPYFVFAKEQADDTYGAAIDERTVGGKTFHEYNVTNDEVRKKVKEFMGMIEQKVFPNG